MRWSDDRIRLIMRIPILIMRSEWIEARLEGEGCVVVNKDDITCGWQMNGKASVKEHLCRYQYEKVMVKMIATLIARFMGPTWAHLGPTGPRLAPYWPHELCYLGSTRGRYIYKNNDDDDRVILSVLIMLIVWHNDRNISRGQMN